MDYFTYFELSLFHVSRKIGNFFPEIGEVFNGGVEEGEPSGNGDGLFIDGFAEGDAVDEDEDLPFSSVTRHRFESLAEFGGDAFEGGEYGWREGVEG